MIGLEFGSAPGICCQQRGAGERRIFLADIVKLMTGRDMELSEAAEEMAA